MNLDNQLPSPSEQLNLLKQRLNKEPKIETFFNIILSSDEKPESINFIHKRPESGEILKSVTLKPLDFAIQEMLSELAESLIRMWNYKKSSNSKLLNVLAPSAMEDGSYLGYTFFADKMCLSGEASIWIKKEDSDIVTPPVPDLVLSR